MKIDSPLSVTVIDGQLVISIGIDRVNGHNEHPIFPHMHFDDQSEWISNVIYELERDDETGATAISSLLDNVMKAAIENGSCGLAENSPIGWTSDGEPTREPNKIHSW